MIKRDIEEELKFLNTSYPVVTITGPRQSGKTTLAKMVFPEYNYCNLEDPETRELAENDPNSFFNNNPCPVIIDEIQRVPKLISYIQVDVDEKKKKGQYILTGSNQNAIKQGISQSLAGRTAILILLPLSIKELIQENIKIQRDRLIYTGFMPGIYSENLDPTRTYRYYFQTYVERDLSQLIRIKDLSMFEKFMKLLAGRTGQLLIMDSLASDTGVSSTTIKEWLSILEASYIIFKLSPYYKNFGKRVIKAQKYYFTEIGLLSYLLGIENESLVNRDPLIGNLFENMVILEALKSRYNQGKDANLFFFRDSNHNEVDLIFEKERNLIPIEIKSASTFNMEFLKGISYFHKNIKVSKNGYVIYSGEKKLSLNTAEVIPYKYTSKIF